MEEKVLIKSEKYDVSKLFRVMVIIGVILTILAFIIDFCYWYQDHSYYNHRVDCYKTEYRDEYLYDKENIGLQEYKMNCLPLEIRETLEWIFRDWEFLLCFIPLVAFPLIGGLIYLWLRSFELTVTDKRIYGKVAWGKRVDLPVDSVSATATLGSKGVSVSTSSGKISFRAIKNANEIYEVVNNLLIERQKKRNNATVIAPVANTTDEADQIKKYKDLLDSGVITQEEFEAKKKQLLGL